MSPRAEQRKRRLEMKTTVMALLVMTFSLAAGVSYAQMGQQGQMGGMGQGQGSGTMGSMGQDGGMMMCPMMGGMMQGGMPSDPKATGMMLQMRGEMMQKIGEIMQKYGKQLSEQK
jgi:hypothetical protein